MRKPFLNRLWLLQIQTSQKPVKLLIRDPFLLLPRCFLYGFFQTWKVAEGSIPKLCDDRGRDVAHGAFRSRLLLKLPDPCRHDRRDIVVAHGLIGICEDDLAFLRGLDHAGLQVVANGSYRNAAEVLIHVDVAPDPGVHLHIKGGLDIGVTAVGQAGNKEIDFDLFAVRLGDPHCWAAPVHFATLPRFMLEVAADRRFRAILVVVVTELCFPDRDVAFGKALFSVLLP